MRLIAFLSLGLCSLALSQHDGQGRPDPRHDMVPFPAFERTVGGTWLARINVATHTPRLIVGTGVPLPGFGAATIDQARRHARQVLVDHADVLGLPASSEFRETTGARMGRQFSFTFVQYVRGIEVIGGRADVRIHETGVLSMLGSTAFPVPDDFAVVPRIGAELATARAWAALGEEPTGVAQPGKVPAPRLVIWGDVDADRKAPFALCWEVAISNVDRDGRGSIGRSYVDAATGAVLHWTNDKHDCGFLACRHAHHGANRRAMHAPPATAPLPVPTTVTVRGWTRTNVGSTFTLTDVPMVNLVVTVPGLGTRTTDALGQFTIDISAPVTISITSLDGTHHTPITGSSAPLVNTLVQPGVPTTIQLLTASSTQEQAAHTTTHYWVNEVNEWVRSLFGNTPELAYISNIQPRVNASNTCNAFYTANSINFYATGGGCNNTALPTVIAHEWGHGLDERYGGISNGNGNGLSEAWGDVVGMYLVDNPVIGAGFTTGGGYIRTGTNTRQWTSVSAGTGPHDAGECFMGMAWQLRQNLRAALGTVPALTISNDIVLGSIVAGATNQPDAVVQVQLADDNDGNLLNGTPHYTEISAACTAHSLPFVHVTVGTLTHTPLPSTTQELTPRKVLADVVPFSGNFTQVRLHFVAGGAPVVRPMIAEGTANRYQAMLPGANAGTAVSYHFEAVHSTGPTLRLPATGEFGYWTGPVVFTETFETNGPGWTHGMVATQDDWQVGDPAGQSGGTWSDPDVAAAGVRCYGNDLGNTIGTQAWNGAYQDNVSNWLRSPVINCAGRTGVRLRFKRWLSVESGQYDQATVHVNGVQVWVNPFATDLVDTAWQQMELAIPQADNNPSVQLEWRLASDQSVVFGGWNIDDVEVVATGPVTPLGARFTMLPEQVAQLQPITFTLQTQGPAPILLALGDQPGPTLVPGVPPILVGGNAVTLTAFTNASGNLTFSFNAPGGIGPTGLTWYSQVLTIDPALNLVTSNQFVNLFTP